MLNVRFFCRGLEELSICPHPGNLTLLWVLVARDHVGLQRSMHAPRSP